MFQAEVDMGFDHERFVKLVSQCIKKRHWKGQRDLNPQGLFRAASELLTGKETSKNRS